MLKRWVESGLTLFSSEQPCLAVNMVFANGMHVPGNIPSQDYTKILLRNVWYFFAIYFGVKKHKFVWKSLSNDDILMKLTGILDLLRNVATCFKSSSVTSIGTPN